MDGGQRRYYGTTKTLCAWVESTKPQVVHNCKWLRIQKNKISEVSDCATYKNKNTTEDSTHDRNQVTKELVFNCLKKTN